MRCAHDACARWAPRFLANRAGRGLVFDEAWYCSRRCVEAEARRRLERAPAPAEGLGRGQNVSRLGAMLVHRRLISTATLEDALIRQSVSGRRLGAELCAMGALQPLELLQALAAQSRAGYLTGVDPERVRPAPGGLSRDVVTALGVVPIEADEEGGRLVVACPAPLPRLALAVLRALSTRTVEALLVADAVLDELLEAYGTAPRRVPPRVTRALSLGDAVQRIAAGVEAGRVSRVQPVRCEPWVWVRLEGAAAPEEIVLPSRAVRAPERTVVAPDPRKDPAWLAAPTAH